MPIDYENMLQYTTPFRCPECSEHTFQTDAKLSSPSALIEAECTNCGHALTREEIDAQVATLPPDAIQAMVAKLRTYKNQCPHEPQVPPLHSSSSLATSVLARAHSRLTSLSPGVAVSLMQRSMSLHSQRRRPKVDER